MAFGISWDATGERYFETGIDRGVLYVQGDNGSYGNGVPWNGLISVTEKPDGAEPNDLYADNIKYASLRSAETYGATIEAYTYPEEFAQCDGSAVVSTGVYIGQQSRKPFGFCYRTKKQNDTASESDDGYVLHIIYNATASPTEKNHETVNDSPDAMTMSWDLDTTPVAFTSHSNLKPTATITIDSTKCGAGALQSLEDRLYSGSLPSPDEVVGFFSGSGT